MPVQWEIRDSVLTLVFTGIVERVEIETALKAALSDPRAGLRMGLLWDARQSETPLSADDVRWRLDLGSALAERGLVDRVALLVSERWSATLDYFRTETDRWVPAFRLAMFVNEAEARAWLEAGEAIPS